MAVTSFAFTDPGLHVTGTFSTTANLSGRAARNAPGVGVELNVSITGTDATLSYNGSSAGSLQITVDGGAPTTPTLTTGNVWSTLTLFSGLEEGAHTVKIKWLNVLASVDSANLLSVTGAAPALAFPAGFVPHYALGTYAANARLEDVTSGNFAGVTAFTSSRVDAMFSFRATCDSFKIFTYQAGNRYRLYVDGVAAGTYTVPNTSTWGWVEAFTGLDGANSHLYSLSVASTFAISSAQNTIHAVMPFVGFAAGSFDATYSPVTRLKYGALGDSITQANFAGNTTEQDSTYGYVSLIRNRLNYAVYNRGVSGQKVSTYFSVNYTILSNISPDVDVASILCGTNDLGAAASLGVAGPPQTFRDDFVTLLNGLLANTTCRFYVLGILPRLSYPAGTIALWNGAGNGIQGAIALCSAPSRITYVDTSVWNFSNVSGVDTYDGLHPNNTGYVKLENNLAPFIAPTGYTLAGPSSGASGVASTNFTVTKIAGTTFNGNDTITLADGGQGGTFTPGVGSPGTGTVTVTPANGATSFAFTYTPASSGAKTLTGTNGPGWTNPSALIYTAAGEADVTAPTLSNQAVSAGGTTLTATLSESGCTPSSGTGGFSLSGTAATVTSWTVSGTTLTLTLSGLVYASEAVTLSYARAATTDDLADASTNYLADFSGASVTNNSTQVVVVPTTGATLTTRADLPAPYPGFGPRPGASVHTYRLAWTSHTDGTVALTTSMALVGEILGVTFVPGSGGSQPTGLYDVVLRDAHGLDVLGGQGANLSNSVASTVCPGVPLKNAATTATRPVAVAGPLSLEITNAGSGKSGTVVLCIR